ncbi:MAG: hypothetical protein AAGI49_14795 [Bacteroidota bacterium]
MDAGKIIQIITITFCIVASSTPLRSQSLRQGCRASIDYYPKKYKKYTAEDWEVGIKPLFDSVLRTKKLLTIEQSVPLKTDVRYLLTRVSDINWSAEQQTEVVEYLGYFAIRMNRKIYLNRERIDQHMSNHPSAYPHFVIWSLLQLDATAGLMILESQIKYMPPRLAIWLARQHFKHPIIPRFLDQLEASSVLTDKEQKDADELRFNHHLSCFKKQKKAWEFLLKTYLPAKASSVQEDIGRISIWQWYDCNRLMASVYDEPDIDLILQLVERMKRPDHVYVLLYSAGFFINGKLSRQKAVPSDLIHRFLTLSVAFYDKYGVERIDDKGGMDKVKDLREMIFAHLNKI